MDEDDGGLSPDSDDEYENSFSKKLKKGGAGGGRKSGGRSRGGRGGQGGVGGSPGGGMGPGGGNSKRRTHADNIPDSEKPFSCEREYFFMFYFHSFINNYEQKYSRQRCLLRVKGLVICILLGCSGSIFSSDKI